MSLADLLVDLGRAGVTLRDAGSGVGFVPRSALTPERAASLAVHKAGILALLAGVGMPEPGTDAADLLAERLGVGDALGMATAPGSPGWMIALGEALGCSCGVATYGVHLGHGETDERDSGGGEGERSDAIRDRQGCERGP